MESAHDEGTYESLMRVTPCTSDRNLLLCVEFTDGYTFRQFIEFTRRSVDQVCFIFDETKIWTSRGNETKTLIINSLFRREDLTKCYVNPELVNNKNPVDPSKWFHIVNPNLPQFYSHIKNIGKKEGVRIIQFASVPNYIFLQFFNGKSKNSWVNVKIEPYTHLQYDIKEVDVRHTRNPNICISLTQFCEAIVATRGKYMKSVLRSYDTGAQIFVESDVGKSGRFSEWGDICESEVKSYHDIRLDQTILASLCKIANFNNGGIVRIYSSMDRLVRLEIPIGCYGVIHIYIIDPEP
jgi:hypothetical protein